MVLAGVLVAGIGIVTALVAVVLSARSEAGFPATAGWVFLTLAAAVPVVTLVLDMQAVQAHVASADIAMKQTVLANSISDAMFTRSSVVMTLGFGFGLISMAGSVASLLSAGPTAKASTQGLIGAFVGGIVGTLACAAVLGLTIGYARIPEIGPAYLILPPLAAVLALTSAASSLRVSDVPAERARSAAWRGFVGLSGFLAIALAAEVAVGMGMLLSFQAVATASADMKQSMLANGIEVSMLSRPFGWAVALIPAATAWGSAAPLVKDLGPRQRLGVALATVQALLILGLVAGSGSPLAAFFG